jgi:hypothetical protein
LAQLPPQVKSIRFGAAKGQTLSIHARSRR